MISTVDKSKCCGCGTCQSVCHIGAISFYKDELGFSYPKVDETLCVNCNQCEKVCPMTNANIGITDSKYPYVFAARHINEHEIEHSRSGAVFVALSDAILEMDGVVYGAGYDSIFSVKHKRATNKCERDEFRGSKYVQSDTIGVLELINNDLRRGKKVLFSGTPCQVAAISRAVPERLKDNLLLVDIICHGVPSPRLFEDYLKSYQRKDDTIVSFNFRDKSLKGWSDHRESIVFSSSEKIYSTVYTYLFYSNSFFRDSCYQCPYANTIRIGDITLGDFWGWEKVNQDFNKDDKGCSLIYVNTIKGERYFSDIKKSLNLIQTDVEHSIQKNLQAPTSKPEKREPLIRLYINKGYDSLIKEMFKRSFKEKIIYGLLKVYHFFNIKYEKNKNN